jgi:hypothetical protein
LLSRICDDGIGKNDRNAGAPAALNMFPKFDDVVINTYLMVLAKIRRLHHAVGQRKSLSRGDVGASARVGAGVDRDPDVGVVWRDASLTPSPKKTTSVRGPLHARCATSCRGRRANTVVSSIATPNAASSIQSTSAPVAAPDVRPRFAADLDRDLEAVAGDHLRRCRAASQRERRRRRPSPVDEDEKPANVRFRSSASDGT